jgi:hypothetical protein
MTKDFQQISWLLDIAYKELTKDGGIDIDTILGCVAEAKAIAEENG